MAALIKRVWIVNYYSAPPEFAANQRHLKFAHYLMLAGYDVTIISSSYLCEKDINLINDKNKFIEVNYGEFNFIHIKSNSYVGNGLKRMMSIIQFAMRLLLLSKRFNKPDVILHNIHIPFDFPIYFCSKLLKSIYIAESWDLWPDSFVRSGLISPRNPLVLLAYELEKFIYAKADQIVFSMEGGRDYLIDRKWDKANRGPIDLDKVHYINTGIDIKEFEANKRSFVMDDHDLIDDSYFKVVYLGSIKLANDVKQLIEAAFILRDYSNIKFLIYGDGDERQSLVEFCEQNEMTNVCFKEKWIPLSNVPYVLSCSSLNILNYMKNFGAYGISSGKFFQYLASGKPICCNIDMDYNLILKHNIGVSKSFSSAKEYAEAILSIKNLDKQAYDDMCHRAKELALQYDYELLSNKLINILN